MMQIALFLTIFLSLIIHASRVLAEEIVVQCPDDHIYRYDDNIIFNDKAFERVNGLWAPICSTDNDYIKSYARDKSAFCEFEAKQPIAHKDTPAEEITDVKYLEAKNIVIIDFLTQEKILKFELLQTLPKGFRLIKGGGFKLLDGELVGTWVDKNYFDIFDEEQQTCKTLEW